MRTPHPALFCASERIRLLSPELTLVRWLKTIVGGHVRAGKSLRCLACRGHPPERSENANVRAGGFDSAPIKLTMPFVALGAAKSLVDDFFWSRWRFEISVFDLVSIGRG